MVLYLAIALSTTWVKLVAGVTLTNPTRSSDRYPFGLHILHVGKRHEEA